MPAPYRYLFLLIYVKDLTTNIFDPPICNIQPLHESIYIHSLVISAFASLIAPFGGFLASGFKRAFKIKDFSEVIPGHGGFADRMDCQFIMGLFTYLYVNNFIKVYLKIIIRNTNLHLKKFPG